MGLGLFLGGAAGGFKSGWEMGKAARDAQMQNALAEAATTNRTQGVMSGSEAEQNFLANYQQQAGGPTAQEALDAYKAYAAKEAPGAYANEIQNRQGGYESGPAGGGGLQRTFATQPEAQTATRGANMQAMADVYGKFGKPEEQLKLEEQVKQGELTGLQTQAARGALALQPGQQTLQTQQIEEQKYKNAGAKIDADIKAADAKGLTGLLDYHDKQVPNGRHSEKVVGTDDSITLNSISDTDPSDIQRIGVFSGVKTADGKDFLIQPEVQARVFLLEQAGKPENRHALINMQLQHEDRKERIKSAEQMHADSLANTKAIYAAKNEKKQTAGEALQDKVDSVSLIYQHNGLSKDAADKKAWEDIGKVKPQLDDKDRAAINALFDDEPKLKTHWYGDEKELYQKNMAKWNAKMDAQLRMAGVPVGSLYDPRGTSVDGVVTGGLRPQSRTQIPGAPAGYTTDGTTNFDPDGNPLQRKSAPAPAPPPPPAPALKKTDAQIRMENKAMSDELDRKAVEAGKSVLQGLKSVTAYR